MRTFRRWDGIQIVALLVGTAAFRPTSFAGFVIFIGFNEAFKVAVLVRIIVKFFALFEVKVEVIPILTLRETFTKISAS